MSKFKNNKILHYTFYQVTKSTALVTPVLYLIFQSKLNVELEAIIQIGAIYTILNFIMEIPLGILADTKGPINAIKFGLYSLICSFLSIIFVKGILGVHLLFLFSSIASNCFSGADQSLLRMILGDDDMSSYRDSAYKVSSNMYLITAPFLVLGVFLYRFDYRLVLILQSLTLLTSLFIVKKYEKNEHYSPKKVTAAKQIESIAHGLRHSLKNTKLLSIVFLNAAFTVAVLLNHRTIQQQIKLNFSENFHLWLASAFAIGNIVSWSSSNIFRKLFNKIENTSLSFVVLLLFFSSIYYGFSLNTATATFISYLGICAFKSAFRPLLGSEMIKNIWNKSDTASVISVISLLVALITATIQWFISSSFSNMKDGNITLLITISSLSLISIVIYASKKKQVIFKSKVGISGKSNEVILSKNIYFFKQNYPKTISPNFIDELVTSIPTFPYPHPRLISSSSENHCITWEALRGQKLTKMKIDAGLIESFISKKKVVNNEKLLNVIESTRMPNFDDIFSSTSEALNEKLKDTRQIEIIHGDLHPDNILLSNNQLYAIDWDLSGTGYAWFDYLTLLFHPWLILDLSSRYELLNKFLPDFSKEELLIITKDFLHFKNKQVSTFIEHDQQYIKLEQEYASLLREVAQ